MTWLAMAINVNSARMWQAISRHRSDAARFAYYRREYETAAIFQKGAAEAHGIMTFYLDKVLNPGRRKKVTTNNTN